MNEFGVLYLSFINIKKWPMVWRVIYKIWVLTNGKGLSQPVWINEMRLEFWPQKLLWVVTNDNEDKAFSDNAVQYHHYMIQNDTCSVFSTKLAILGHIINNKLLKYAPYIASMECTLIVLEKNQHATMRFNWTMPAKFQNRCWVLWKMWCYDDKWWSDYEDHIYGLVTTTC